MWAESYKWNRKAEAQRLRETEKLCFSALLGYAKLLQEWKRLYAPRTPEEKWHPHFVEVCEHLDYKKMSESYEAEQERLKLEIEVTEEWVEQREEMNEGLDSFISLTQKYVDVEELTPTIVNEYIKKIVVYAPDKSSAKRTQKVKIFFNFVDDVDIPVISEPVITKTSYERRKTA